MKRFLFILFIVLLLVGVGVAGYMLWNNRSVFTAWGPPPQNIADLFESPVSIPENTASPRVAAEDIKNSPFTLPAGFSVALFADGLGVPRDLLFDPAGHVLVSIPKSGKVVALPDDNKDGKADRVAVVAEGLRYPHGLAMRTAGDRQELFIAETTMVARYDYDAQSMSAIRTHDVASLPPDGEHTTRSLLFVPGTNDTELLIAVGSSCNVCSEKDERRAAVLVANLSDNTARVYAKGLRNSVFLTTRSGANDVWATDMGRDFLGDNLPPDEINILRDGADYGWPFCYGANIADTRFRKDASCDGRTASHSDIPAHSAPLGLAFLEGDHFPSDYRNNLLVAFHGSWNRSTPTGYKIVRYPVDVAGNVSLAQDFMTGWLKNGTAIGRPVDILVGTEGEMYISDDKAGAVYLVHQ